MRTKGPVLRLFATIAIVGALCLATATVADSPDDDRAVDEILWPPADQFDRANRSTLGAELLAVDDPTVVARQPLDGIGIERLDPDRSEIVLRGGEAGETRLSIPHEPVAEEDRRRSPIPMSMDTADLPSVVRVKPSIQGQSVAAGLGLYGPPGAFDVTASNGSDWRSIRDAGEELGSQLGLPSADRGDEFETEWRTVGGAAHPWPDTVDPETIVISSELCTAQNASECYRIWASCDNCTIAWGRVHPTPGEQLTEASDSDVDVGSTAGWAHALFDGAEPVHLSMDTAVDLDTSAFVDPGEARDEVIANLSERGYQIDQTYGEEVSELTKTRLTLAWSEDSRRLDGAHYEWFTIVNATGNESSRAYNVDLEQNAFTGEIVDFEIRPNAASDEDDQQNTKDGTASGESTPPRRAQTTGARTTRPPTRTSRRPGRRRCRQAHSSLRSPDTRGSVGGGGAGSVEVIERTDTTPSRRSSGSRSYAA
jgi:hypothetical protein